MAKRSLTPILDLDRSWEAGGEAVAVGAFLDPGTGAARLYYRVRFSDDPRRNVLCLALSTDLETWQKPDWGDGTHKLTVLLHKEIHVYNPHQKRTHPAHHGLPGNRSRPAVRSAVL